MTVSLEVAAKIQALPPNPPSPNLCQMGRIRGWKTELDDEGGKMHEGR